MSQKFLVQSDLTTLFHNSESLKSYSSRLYLKLGRGEIIYTGLDKTSKILSAGQFRNLEQNHDQQFLRFATFYLNIQGGPKFTYHV